MPQIREFQSSFTAGELSADLLGRSDLRAYQNGARRLQNVFVQPTGGVFRRDGLRFVGIARGPGRLVAFEFSTEQVYLLVFTERMVDIYRGSSHIGALPAPWTLAQVRQINWTQSADTLLIVHPEVPPQRLTRGADGTWSLAGWGFSLSAEGRMNCPFFRYAPPDVMLKPSATTGDIGIWSPTAGVFNEGHIGSRLRLNDREVLITGIVPGWGILVRVIETLVEPWQSADWVEQAWSNARGWPTSVCFHQDRLVVGGSRDLPNRLWMSKSADLFNFDLGEGLDDEAIEFPILSDQVNAIRHVFSGRHLQVFTSGGEWMVGGEPLTPTNVQVYRQTKIGSALDRTVPPRDVDGATLFVPRIGQQLREFLYTDAEQAYQASDLALLAHHLFAQPVDMDFDKVNRLFHVVMADGEIATVTIYRQEAVTAWSRQVTAGKFLAVTSVGDEVYVLVQRTGGTFIEAFDRTLQVDSALAGTSAVPTRVWSGLAHLEGQAVSVSADGAPIGGLPVVGGQVALAAPATSAQIGLPFTHVIEPLPPKLPDGTAIVGRLRPVTLSLRLWQTRAVGLDVGKGAALVDMDEGRGAPALILQQPYSGDKRVRLIGWRPGSLQPLWRIEQSLPLPFALLSATLEITVNG